MNRKKYIFYYIYYIIFSFEKRTTITGNKNNKYICLPGAGRCSFFLIFGEISITPLHQEFLSWLSYLVHITAQGEGRAAGMQPICNPEIMLKPETSVSLLPSGIESLHININNV